MFALDPSPHEDLPSDVEFGAWLESLDPLVVLLDLEPAVTGEERWRLTYLRRKLVRSPYRKTPSSPVEGSPERRER